MNLNKKIFRCVYVLTILFVTISNAQNLEQKKQSPQSNTSPLYMFYTISKGTISAFSEHLITPLAKRWHASSISTTNVLLLPAAFISYFWGKTIIDLATGHSLFDTPKDRIATEQQKKDLVLLQKEQQIIFRTKKSHQYKLNFLHTLKHWRTLLGVIFIKPINESIGKNIFNKIITKISDLSAKTNCIEPKKIAHPSKAQQQFMTECTFNSNTSFILDGPPGTGKTATIEGYLDQHPETKGIRIPKEFSANFAVIIKQARSSREPFALYANLIKNTNVFIKQLLWQAEEHCQKNPKNNVIFIFDEADALQILPQNLLIKKSLSKQENILTLLVQKLTNLDSIMINNSFFVSLAAKMILEKDKFNNRPKELIETLTGNQVNIAINIMINEIINNKIFFPPYLYLALKKLPQEEIDQLIETCELLLAYILFSPFLNYSSPFLKSSTTSSSLTRIFESLELPTSINTMLKYFSSPFEIQQSKNFTCHHRTKVCLITNHYELLDSIFQKKEYWGHMFNRITFSLPTAEEFTESFGAQLQKRGLSEEKIKNYMQQCADLKLSYRGTEAIVNYAIKDFTTTIEVALCRAIDLLAKKNN